MRMEQLQSEVYELGRRREHLHLLRVLSDALPAPCPSEFDVVSAEFQQAQDSHILDHSPQGGWEVIPIECT